MERELKKLNVKIIWDRQNFSKLIVKENTLELEIENLENELQNTGLFTYAFEFFIINRKIQALNKKKVEVNNKVRTIEKRIADKESKMVQLKNDLKKIEKKKFLNSNLISFAMFLFLLSLKYFMIQIIFQPSSIKDFYFYWFLFK